MSSKLKESCESGIVEDTSVSTSKSPGVLEARSERGDEKATDLRGTSLGVSWWLNWSESGVWRRDGRVGVSGAEERNIGKKNGDQNGKGTQLASRRTVAAAMRDALQLRRLVRSEREGGSS